MKVKNFAPLEWHTYSQRGKNKQLTNKYANEQWRELKKKTHVQNVLMTSNMALALKRLGEVSISVSYTLEADGYGRPMAEVGWSGGRVCCNLAPHHPSGQSCHRLPASSPAARRLSLRHTRVGRLVQPGNYPNLVALPSKTVSKRRGESGYVKARAVWPFMVDSLIWSNGRPFGPLWCCWLIFIYRLTFPSKSAWHVE